MSQDRADRGSDFHALEDHALGAGAGTRRRASVICAAIEIAISLGERAPIFSPDGTVDPGERFGGEAALRETTEACAVRLSAPQGADVEGRAA